MIDGINFGIYVWVVFTVIAIMVGYMGDNFGKPEDLTTFSWIWILCLLLFVFAGGMFGAWQELRLLHP